MKTRHILGVVVGLFIAASLGVVAQIEGGGIEGGNKFPGGSAFATQYKLGTGFGGTGPGTSGHVLTSNGNGMAPTYQANASGSVTSVGLSAPALFTVTNSPVTTTGTLTVNYSGTALPVANGGTNLTSSADDNLMVGNGTTWETKAVPNCVDTGGNHLNYTASSNSFSCGTSGSGAGTTGTFTLTWTDACTTSPTTEVDWTLDPTGTVVTWYIGPMSVTSCTSDSTAFTTSTGDVPANLRPPSGESFVLMGVRYVDNGTTGAALGCLRVLDEGTVLVHQATNGCLGGAWTGSGSKAVNGTAAVSTSATYRLHP